MTGLIPITEGCFSVCVRGLSPGLLKGVWAEACPRGSYKGVWAEARPRPPHPDPGTCPHEAKGPCRCEEEERSQEEVPLDSRGGEGRDHRVVVRGKQEVRPESGMMRAAESRALGWKVGVGPGGLQGEGSSPSPCRASPETLILDSWQCCSENLIVGKACV